MPEPERTASQLSEEADCLERAKANMEAVRGANVMMHERLAAAQALATIAVAEQLAALNRHFEITRDVGLPIRNIGI